MSPSTEARRFNLIHKTILCIAFLVILVGGVSAQTEGTGLRGMAVVPVMFRQPARAGATVVLPIGVTNLEPTPLKVKLDIHSVTYKEWTYGPMMDTATKFDCSTWFAETTITGSVPPRDQHVFPVKLTVPKGTEPGVYYCLGTIVPNIVGDNSVIVTQYQIPIILYVGTQPKADLKLGTPELTASTKDNYVEVPFKCATSPPGEQWRFGMTLTEISILKRTASFDFRYLCCQMANIAFRQFANPVLGAFVR